MHYFLSMQKVALQTKNVDYFNIGVYRDWLTTAAVFEWLFEELQFLKMFTLNTQIKKTKTCSLFSSSDWVKQNKKQNKSAK